MKSALALGAAVLAGVAGGVYWDGRHSRETLTYTEALEIIADTEQPAERRLNALGRVHVLSETAGRLFNLVATEDPDHVFRADAKELRSRVAIAWGPP